MTVPLTAPQKDFFISYNKADLQWAEWIAWELEAAGYTTVLQAWDFRPGSNFVLEMQEAAQARRTIAVLSQDYLAAFYTQPEWAAAFAQDPTGMRGTLLPIRVRECELTGLLAPIIYSDLVGLDVAVARERLLADARRERAKPTQPPAFPGTPGRMRQNSERNWVSVRVGMWCCLPDLAYAACSTAHTSPHRSAKIRRWSAKETVSVRC